MCIWLYWGFGGSQYVQYNTSYCMGSHVNTEHVCTTCKPTAWFPLLLQSKDDIIYTDIETYSPEEIKTSSLKQNETCGEETMAYFCSHWHAGRAETCIGWRRRHMCKSHTHTDTHTYAYKQMCIHTYVHIHVSTHTIAYASSVAKQHTVHTFVQGTTNIPSIRLTAKSCLYTWMKWTHKHSA